MVDIYKVYDGNFMQNPPSHQFKIWTLAWRRDGGGNVVVPRGLRSLARPALARPVRDSAARDFQNEPGQDVGFLGRERFMEGMNTKTQPK